MVAQIAQRTAIYLSAGVICLMCGFPLYWMVLTSLKPDAEIIQAVPTFFTWQAHLDAYQRLFTQTRSGGGWVRPSGQYLPFRRRSFR